MSPVTLADLSNKEVQALEERALESAARFDDALTDALTDEIQELPEEIDDEYLAQFAEVVQS